jgi:HYR domain-containing protein
MNRLTKAIIGAGAFIALFSLVTASLPSGSAAAVRQTKLTPIFNPKLVAAQCPPVTTINGTLGSGSPDFPATSGQQTGRIVNGLGNINCGSANPCSLNTATGSRAFDAYTFTNADPGTACVTVNFTMSGCSLAASLQFSARLGTFDPANPCANYVGDGGAGFSGLNDRSFSFNVPAGQDFVVVVNENDEGGAVGCPYTLTISGLACQASAACPPATAINGTVGSGSPDYPATIGQQTGRIVNGLGNLNCGSANPCSLNTTSGSRAFDAYTFLNSGSSTACVTVAFTMSGCSLAASLQFSARLGSFDPANPCANYVGDAGAGFSGLSDGSFSFNVPAGQNFVVVVNENDPGGAVGCAYSLTISGVSCVASGPPACSGITCPSSIVVPNTQGQCGAVVSYLTPTAAAGCGTVTCSPVSGSSFPVGSTTVTCNTSSASSCSFSVTVNETELPTITCPANLTVSNTAGQCNATVNYPATTASDNCAVASVCSPPSGSTFAIGTTTVSCTATDASGKTASCAFTVTVNDTQPPTITCPLNIAVSNTAGQCNATVNYAAPSASDNCGVPSVVCSPPSGSTFAVGTTTVNCTAIDASDRSASCSFTVTVNDTQPPTITCPADITAVAAATCPASLTKAVNFPAPTASDNCPGVTVVCSPASGSIFPVGTTTVTCTATDRGGNPASCTFAVSVFNVCLQDDSNPSTVVLLNSSTGEYRFCCGGTTFDGIGTVKIKGCTITLQDNTSDFRVVASVDNSVFRGSASLQSPPGTIRCAITDRDTRNNNCFCQ